MPYSSSDLDELFLKIAARVPYQTVLDIGAGAGKYGTYIRRMRPHVFTTAIECEPTYINKFNLTAIYDNVRVMDVCELINEVDSTYDFVIIGDCIEHLRKSDGIDLLNFLVYRAKYIWVAFPERYVQNSVKGVKSEAHLSVWCPGDFAMFDAISFKNRNPKSTIVGIAIHGFLIGKGDPRLEDVIGITKNGGSKPN